MPLILNIVERYWRYRSLYTYTYMRKIFRMHIQLKFHSEFVLNWKFQIQRLKSVELCFKKYAVLICIIEYMHVIATIHPSRLKMLNKRWFNVGPSSTTLYQR